MDRDDPEGASLPADDRTSTRDAPDDPAETLRRGIRAYRKGEFAEALPLIEACARAGSLDARKILSRMYYAGQGVEADPERYLYWLARAAELGDPAARSKLKRRHAAGDMPESLLDDPFISGLIARGRAR